MKREPHFKSPIASQPSIIAGRRALAICDRRIVKLKNTKMHMEEQGTDNMVKDFTSRALDWEAPALWKKAFSEHFGGIVHGEDSEENPGGEQLQALNDLNDLNDYFPESPVKKMLHLVVQPPTGELPAMCSALQHHVILGS